MKKISKRISAALLSSAMFFSLLSGMPVTAGAAVKADGKTPVKSLIADTGSVLSGEVTVIIEVEGDPVLCAEGIAETGISAYHDTAEAQKTAHAALTAQKKVQKSIDKKIENAQTNYSYTNVINGFSMTIDSADIDTLKGIDGVKAVYLSQKHELTDPVPAANTEAFDVEDCCDMIGVNYMHENGYTGEGKLIAVIDTELDVNHEMFAGEISNPRYSKSDIKELIDGNELNVFVSANQVYRSEKIPFAYNYSMSNADVYNADFGIVHGTHVCGIAVGNNGTTPDGGKFTGVAPDAQLLFFGTPYLEDEAVLAALDDAAKMNVDAVNCSFGWSNALAPLYREAMQNLNNAGIFVSASAGNDSYGNGYSPQLPTETDYSTGGTPQDLSSVTSIASAGAASYWTTHYKLTVDGNEIEYTQQGDMDLAMILSGDSWEYVDCGLGCEEDFDGLDLSGKIALVKRGENTFAEKEIYAASVGASGLIIINTEESIDTSIEMLGMVPTILVSASDGEILLNAEEKLITVDGEGVHFKIADEHGGKVNAYSSWGTNTALELKPDLMTPGGNIYSSVPDDEYDILSGTSMAAPHMAGAVTLLDQVINEKYVDSEMNRLELKNYLLMSTANIVNAYEDEDITIPYSPRLQGAGMANLKAASETQVILTGDNGKTSLSLKDNLGDTFQLSFAAVNLSGQDVTYDSVTLYVMTDDYYEYVDEENEDAEPINCIACGEPSRLLSYTCDLPDSVTVPANGQKDISLDVTLDSNELKENLEIFTNGFFVEGYVVLDSSDEAIPQLGIPYMGYYGDWTAADVLDGYYYDNFNYNGSSLVSGYDDSYDVYNDFVALDYMNTLGQNMFELSDIYDKEEYAGISPNGDGLYDYLGVSPYLLRNISYRNVEIRDAEGNLILDEGTDVDTSQKYASNGIVYTMHDLPLEEGDYTVTYTATLAYEGAQPQSIEMKFYVDNEYPGITDAVVFEDEEDGCTYLQISASDNRYLMGAEIYEIGTEDFPDGFEDFDFEGLFSEEGAPIHDGEEDVPADPIDGEFPSDDEDIGMEDVFYACAPFEPGSEGTVLLDVTGQDLSNTTIAVYDYAWNITEISTAELLGMNGFYYGDVNCDTQLRADDALAILRHVVQLTSLGVEGDIELILADVNEDGRISAEDALMVLQMVVRLIDTKYYVIGSEDAVG